jgi:hypothetical protein
MMVVEVNTIKGTSSQVLLYKDNCPLIEDANVCELTRQNLILFANCKNDFIETITIIIIIIIINVFRH